MIPTNTHIRFISYICIALHTQRRADARQKIAGFFYARTLKYSGSVPPCDVLMDSLPLRCNATGKAEPSFISAHTYKFLQMHYTEKRQKLSLLKENWAVAEVQVSYKPKHRTGIVVNSSHSAYNVFSHMWDKSLINIQEQLACIYLNATSEVIGYRLISTGKVSTSVVDFNLIITCALLCRATSCIIAHNHPSGSTKPSNADKCVTETIKWRLSDFEITLSDHLILTDGSYLSFADNGIIFND